MGFWIFMTVCVLMLPVLMILLGRAFEKHPPRAVSGVYGYRTPLSMKNQDTWDFAQVYFGKLWRKTGWIMLPLALFVMLVLLGRSEDAVGWGGSVTMLAECAVLIAVVFPVERALKRNFDGDGNRKRQ